MEPDLVTANGVEIRIEPYTDTDAFRWKYGQPASTDPTVLAEWEATQLPVSGALRRRAAIYLHELHGGQCGICLTDIHLQAPQGHPGHIQIDHVRPTARGGPDVWSNVRPAHASCNSERGNGEILPLQARALLARKIKALTG